MKIRIQLLLLYPNLMEILKLELWERLGAKLRPASQEYINEEVIAILMKSSIDIQQKTTTNVHIVLRQQL